MMNRRTLLTGAVALGATALLPSLPAQAENTNESQFIFMREDDEVILLCNESAMQAAERYVLVSSFAEPGQPLAVGMSYAGRGGTVLDTLNFYTTYMEERPNILAARLYIQHT